MRNLIDGSGAVVGAADYSAFGEYRNQTGVTSRFGFTGEYYAQETGMWHLRARDLHPGLGRFLSADPVQPNAPGTQGYNRYAYVANNPTTWVDPSGYSVEPLAADQALLGMMYAMHRSLHSVLRCALSEECRDLQALMKKLGSRGANFMVWTAEELQKAFFSTYPHQPTPVDPGLLVLSIGLSNTPILGDLYDLYTGVTGYDPITGQYLAGWERLANIAGGLILFPGITGSNIRHGVHAVESLIDSGDELAQLVGTGCRINSFSEETPVATDEGAVPISEVDVGDRVLAWNEVTNTTGYSAVSATFSHVDATIVELTIDGETLETTAEHPFYVVADAPWLATGETQGRWVEAGDLQVGDAVQQADGTTGTVTAVAVVAQPQRMYNLTVADAHTFFVGDGEWLVHNCGIASVRDFIPAHGIAGDGATKRVIRLAQEMKENGFQNIPAVSVISHEGKLILVDGHHRVAAARLARIDVPYEIVDETWLVANTGWSSIAEVVADSMKFNAFHLTEKLLKKAGFR